MSSHKYYQPSQEPADQANLGALITKILSYKWSIGVVALLVFSLAFLYTTKATKFYEAGGQILFTKDNKQKSAIDILAVSPGPNASTNSAANLDDEMSLLLSPELLQSVVEKLNMHIRSYRYHGAAESMYIDKDGLAELYTQNPLSIAVKKGENIDAFSNNVYFMIEVVDEQQFKLSIGISYVQYLKKQIKSHFGLLRKDEQDFYGFQQIFSFDDPFTTPWLGGKISRLDQGIKAGEKFVFSYGSEEDGIRLLNKNIKIERTNKTGNIIGIQLYDEVAERAPVIVNTVMETYLELGLAQETQSDSNVLKFIDDQLAMMRVDLERESKSIESFKANNKFLDLSAKTQLKVNSIADLEKRKFELEIEETILNNMLSSLKQASYDAIPTISAQTTTNTSISANLTKLQELSAARSSMLVDYTPAHPDIIKTEENIQSLKATLLKSMQVAIQENRKKRQTLLAAIHQYEKELSTAPTQEKTLSELNRNYLVHTKVYDFLLQRKAEVGITRSAKEAKGRIITYAVTPKTASKPNKPVILIIGLFAGLFFGVVQALVRALSDDRIYSLADVQRYSHMPIYGLLPEFGDKRSLYDDAMRSLMFRISKELQHQHKVITITGSVPGEGRLTTMVALCRTISQTGKKAIAIDFDIRANYSNPSKTGVITYLMGLSQLDDIIYSADGMDVIPVGDIDHAGFTMDVFLSDKIQAMFQTLTERYDYVLVQSPYLGLLSDAMVLANLASLNLIVLRSGSSRIDYIKSANRLVDDYKLANTAFIINGLPLSEIRPWQERKTFFLVRWLKKVGMIKARSPF